MIPSRTHLSLAAILVIAYLAATPGRACAQYNCPVSIQLKGKTVLQGSIRDVERPPTAVLWEEKLKTLPFSPTGDGKGLSVLKGAEKTKIEGEIRVVINGAGEVDLKEICLVPNKFNASTWVIAPNGT